MQVRRYWASVQIQKGSGRRRISTRVWGGSDESEAAARAEAQRRAEAVDWDRVLARERSPSEPGNYSYLRGANPEPMLDEALDEQGARAGAITINRYGARVLNTASLAFIDVDTNENPERVMQLLNPAAPITPVKRPGLLGRLKDALSGPPEASPEQVRDAVAQGVRGWVGQSSGRAARLYRTAAGLRLLLVNPPMDPAADETRELMLRFGSDPAYVALCRVQASFRARLTPKPWRLQGFDKLLPKINYETIADDRTSRWLDAYASASRGHAVCELLDQFGTNAAPDPTAGLLLKLHDEETGVGSGLPLA
ncbi:MAG: hypothetical protein R3B57_06115 [Phycisphaerales bacterium]